ncbi:MAG: hypothetical protein AB7V56_06905 [Candidatus Nitrosocosmicus sp.]
MILSTPKKSIPQKDAFGNIYETHRSLWSKEDLKQFGQSHFIEDDISWICYISSEPDLIDEFKKELRTLRNCQKIGS